MNIPVDPKTVANPFKWSPNVKSLSGLVVIVGSMFSGIVHLEGYLGERISSVSRAYQRIADSVEKTERDVKTVRDEVTAVEMHVAKHDQRFDDLDRAATKAATAATKLQETIAPDTK